MQPVPPAPHRVAPDDDVGREEGDHVPPIAEAVVLHLGPVGLVDVDAVTAQRERHRLRFDIVAADHRVGCASDVDPEKDVGEPTVLDGERRRGDVHAGILMGEVGTAAADREASQRDVGRHDRDDRALPVTVDHRPTGRRPLDCDGSVDGHATFVAPRPKAESAAVASRIDHRLEVVANLGGSRRGAGGWRRDAKATREQARHHGASHVEGASGSVDSAIWASAPVASTSGR